MRLRTVSLLSCGYCCSRRQDAPNGRGNRMTPSRRCCKRVRLVSMCLAITSIASGHAAAQTTDVEAGVGFVGGAILLATTPSPADPSGYGYIASNFHGSLPWAVGFMMSGGVMAGEHLSVGAEAAWRRASTLMLEQSRGHFDFVDVRGKYTRTELLISAVSQGHLQIGPRLSILPVAGLTFSRDRRSLTGREGTYSYPPIGTISTRRPDVIVSSVRMGLIAGADGAFARKHANLVLGTRVYWLKADRDLRTLPKIGQVSFQFHAGIRWRG